MCARECLSISPECFLSHIPPQHPQRDARTEQKYCLCLNDQFTNVHETKSLESWVMGTLLYFKEGQYF